MKNEILCGFHIKDPYRKLWKLINLCYVIYFRFKDAKKLRELSVFAITQLLPSRKGDNLFIRAKLVQDTLKVFFSSADRTISLDNTPTQRMNDNGSRVYIEVDKRQVISEITRSLWVWLWWRCVYTNSCLPTKLSGIELQYIFAVFVKKKYAKCFTICLDIT